MAAADSIPPGVDPTRPSSGRLYDLYLGGTEHLEVDRKAADLIRAKVPELEDIAWANRGFLQRAATWLAAHAGVRQFLDIGAGLPTRNNTHEAVHSVAPDARVAYVDNDPMVLAHARSLLEGTDNTVFVTGDFREPEGILKNPEVRALIDFDQPVALILAAVVHFVLDEQRPYDHLRTYLDAFSPGSYLALSHITADRVPPEGAQAFLDVYNNSSSPGCFRTKSEVERLFDGLEFVAPFDGAGPGVTYAGLWGAEDTEAADSDGSRWIYCGVARRR